MLLTVSGTSQYRAIHNLLHPRDDERSLALTYASCTQNCLSKVGVVPRQVWRSAVQISPALSSRYKYACPDGVRSIYVMIGHLSLKQQFLMISSRSRQGNVERKAENHMEASNWPVMH
jgi:hypothetical protein